MVVMLHNTIKISRYLFSKDSIFFNLDIKLKAKSEKPNTFYLSVFHFFRCCDSSKF